MVFRSVLNTRMKDFYDVWLLSRHFEFAGEILRGAIEATFRHRGTEIDAESFTWLTEFGDDVSKNTQWRAYLRKSHLTDVPENLAAVTGAIAEFLVPPATAIALRERFSKRWPPAGPWIDL